MDQSSAITLNRLLSRLDQTLLSQNSDQATRLRDSQYERNKVGSNLEYARALLLTLEKQSSTIRIQAQRQQTQADLQSKRDLIKRLNAKLQELNQLGDQVDEDDSEDDDEDPITTSYAPARTDTKQGLETGGKAQGGLRIPEQLSAELRSRRPLQAADNHSAASTTAREQLFADRAPQRSDPSVSQSETLLSHNRTEQETLTTGLLGLARALKESSLQFSSSLEAEKDVLKRAEGGLDKNAQGMEAAGKRMSMLRSMSEGQGWWGRLKLYAFIFMLWVACFLIVFVGPKLRL